MKILAIDTSSKICSTAILEEDKVIDEITLDDGKTHSENLMPIVEEILTRNKMELSDIDLIAVSVGPGSFTGIRIGVASVKAMAEVNNLPIASVTSLETLARIDEVNNIKVSLIDCKNNQVYCGIFNENFEKIEDYIADSIENVIEELKKYQEFICVGDGAVLHKDLILESFPKVKFIDKNEQSAVYVGKMGYKKYLKHDTVTADTVNPIYLRKSQAERMKEESVSK